MHTWNLMGKTKTMLILLMVQKSSKLTSWGKGSLSTIIYKVLYIQTMVVWDFWTINSIFFPFSIDPWKLSCFCLLPPRCRQVVAIEIGGFSLSTTNQLGRRGMKTMTISSHNHWTSVENSAKKWKERKRSYWRYTHFFWTEPWLLGGSSQLVSS